MRKYWQDLKHLFHYKKYSVKKKIIYILFFYLFIFSKGIYRRTSLTSSSMGTNKQAVSTRPGPNYGAIPNICTCLNVNISRRSYYDHAIQFFLHCLSLSLSLSLSPSLSLFLSLSLSLSLSFSHSLTLPVSIFQYILHLYQILEQHQSIWLMLRLLRLASLLNVDY